MLFNSMKRLRYVLACAPFFMSGYTLAGPTETTVNVAANQMSVDSGVVLTADEVALITATGTWRRCSKSAAECVSDADGTTMTAGGNATLNTVNRGALIGTFDNLSTFVAIGKGPVLIEGVGRLRMLSNRYKPLGPVWLRQHKSGSVNVTITVFNKYEDTDGDGLLDIDELNLGTDYYVADTDGDGFSDGDEVTASTDPLDKMSKPYEVGQCMSVANNARLDDRAQLSVADLAVGGQLMLGHDSRVSATVAVGRKLVMRDRSAVQGDVTVNGEAVMQNGATVSGVLNLFTATDNVIVNAVSKTTNNGNNVWINHGGQKVLAPGHYGTVTVNDRATLKLTAGDYTFNRLVVSNDAKLAYSGDVKVTVNTQVTLRDRARVYALDTQASFSLYSHQTTALVLGNSVNFTGQVHLPAAQLRLGHRNSFNGCVNAKGLRIGHDSVFTEGTFVPLK